MMELLDYCKSRCQKTIREYDHETIEYHRGLYIGYYYGIRLADHLIKKKLQINNMSLYRFVKDEKLRVENSFTMKYDRRRGVTHALYDLMNFVSSS